METVTETIVHTDVHTDKRTFDDQHKEHNQRSAPLSNPLKQDMTMFKVLRFIQVATIALAALCIYIYINDVDSWSRRNVFYLLSTVGGFVLSGLFFVLLFKKEQSKVLFIVPVVFDLVTLVCLAVGAFMVTMMLGDFNYYGFCGARVLVYSYNYYINCRALTSSIILGFIGSILTLLTMLLGVKSAIGSKTA